MELPRLKCAVVIFAMLFTAALTLPNNHAQWIQLGKPAANHELVLTFAIKQTNPGWLDERLRAVSYPGSPEYGNYMNFDEIAKYVHGRPESVQAVVDALAAVGVGSERIDFTLGLDFAVVTIPVKAAEILFSADFYEFHYTANQADIRIVKSADFSLPSRLVGHVDFVSGVREFSTPRPKPSRTPEGQPDNLKVTPKDISESYNTSGYVSKSLQNSQAIAGFLGQYFDESDLETFQKKYDLPVRPVDKIVGENKPSDPGDEALLDVQYISSTGRNVSTWFISISTTADHGQEDFLSWVVGQINTTNSPWVHSASYGDPEDSQLDLDYVARVEEEFKKFGVSGRTILFASGDSGVDCQGITDRVFRPSWPASSPYITSVGGTTSLKAVWSEGGGGFSTISAMPDYQKSVVEAYLKSGTAPASKYFNSSGRAYPDVSVFSTDYIIVDHGISIPVSGTSCAAPTFAGIISSLNDLRLLSGKTTLGFLNPLLYQTLQGKGFFDITEGANSGGFFCPGFDAIEGWDPASGWGSPNFGILKTMIV